MTKIERLEKAILIRRVEESLLQLFKEGKINGTVHTCVGQEFIGVAISEYLNEGDFVVSNHRGHGHYIARTDDVNGLIAELMGKTIGASGGFGGSQHLVNKNYISNGIQGGMTPIATGISLGFKLRKENNIAVAYIGDGTLGEGILYETLNIASLWNCPILFVLENNQYAQSTSFNQNFSGNIKDRLNGFGVNYLETNTWDLNNLFSVSEQAVNYVRNESKPMFLEIKTYRLNPHSKGDDNRFKDEIQDYVSKDPINVFQKSNPEEYELLINKINPIISNAIEIAEKSESLKSIDNIKLIENKPVTEVLISSDTDLRINDLIYLAIKEEMENNPNSTLIGEDIEYENSFTESPYGGAFKVTKDLNVLYPDRVRNTPISEAAITGISNGLAIVGFRSITEIMFGDFCTLILDQLLQHGAKFNKMFNNLVNVPHVIRTPMGGKRGYGPTHSQSIEKHFLGIPDLNVIALNYKIDPRETYKAIFNNIQNPCLVIENKVLYTKKLNSMAPVGFDAYKTIEDFPTVIIKPTLNTKPDVTVFCYGEVLEDAENAIAKAFEEEEIVCEIICPTQICPLNISSLLDSLKKTKKLVIVEEGAGFAALGSEVIAAIIENGIQIERVKRIGNHTLIPSSFQAELNLLPNAHSIYNSIVEIF